MGALTPTSIVRESAGSVTAYFVKFASVSSGATGDTWSSGLPNIIGAFAQATTAGNSSVSCSYVQSTGVITLNPTDKATEVNLTVYSKT